MPVKRFLRLLLLSALCISVSSVSATARAHVEEKTQDQRISESVAREVQVGERVKTEVEKHFSLVENPVLTARVASVFNRLTPYTSRPLPYSVAIVKDRYPNAFCIPGGNVYVTTALLDFVKSDDELAFILAHELGHADGNHVIRQLERNQRLSLASLALAVATKGKAGALVLSNLAATAVSGNYSRKFEREADLKAVEFADRAGYDLSAGVTVMERFAFEELKRPYYDPGICRDHPKTSERIDCIAEAIRARGGNVERKDVLGLLRAETSIEDGLRVLKVDSSVIASGKDTPAFREACVTACGVLKKALQLETPSFDVRIVRNASGVRVLYVGMYPVFREKIPGCGFSLEEMRSALISALNSARSKNPVRRFTHVFQ